MCAAVTTTANSSPIVSVAMWRLRPLVFLPLWRPRHKGNYGGRVVMPDWLVATVSGLLHSGEASELAGITA
jgi:hypothetical protein